MLKKLFGGANKRTPTQAYPELTMAMREAINNLIGSRRIPAMPTAAQKAFQLSVDPNADAQDFIEVIETDEGLSARVLKIANSVYFDRGASTQTIEESVTVIGINEIRSLLNATTLSEIFPCRDPARIQLWAHDIATGIIARELAHRASPSLTGAAFLGGLMHDIGKLLMLQRLTSEYHKVLRRVQQGAEFCEAEQELWVCDHTEVGHLIGERWNFSQELIQIIRCHHDPWPARPTKQPSLTSVVKAADVLSHSLGLGHPPGYGALQSRAAQAATAAWDHMHVSGADRDKLAAHFVKLFNKEYDLYVHR